MNALGNRLRQLRDAEGLTVRQFADRIGKTPGYVSRIEARGEVPSPQLLCTIAQEYHVPAEELLQLAKQSQMARTERQIEARHASALALYRKERRGS